MVLQGMQLQILSVQRREFRWQVSLRLPRICPDNSVNCRLGRLVVMYHVIERVYDQLIDKPKPKHER
jgi:hypothetical protein